MPDRGQNKNPGFATRAIHLGYHASEAHGAVTPPIYMTSTYGFESVEDAGAVFAGKAEGYGYGRTKNPTQAILEERIASLEGAGAGLVTASGMGAITAACWTLLKAGDRVVTDGTLYGSTYAYLYDVLPRFGVEVVAVDLTDAAKLEDALTKETRLVYFETPANPNLRIIDVAAVTARARQAGALSLVDNTFATPVLQRPIELGADLVVHSATKFLGGHSDLLAGAVVGEAALIGRLRKEGLRLATGATLSPINAFLIMRGLMTLELRVRHLSQSAATLAARLKDHARVERVFYPGLASSPGHDVALRQMSAGGALLGLEIKGGVEAGKRFLNALNLVTRAVSLGGTETLIQHPASMTHAVYPADVRRKHGISDGLIRMSLGLETLEDIWDDLEQALEAV